MTLSSSTKLARALAERRLVESTDRFCWHVQQCPAQFVFTAEECGLHGPRLDILSLFAEFSFGEWDSADEVFTFNETGPTREFRLKLLHADMFMADAAQKERKAIAAKKKREYSHVTTYDAYLISRRLPTDIERVAIPRPMDEYGSQMAFLDCAEFDSNLRCEGYTTRVLDDCRRSICFDFDPCPIDPRWWMRDHEANVDDAVFHALIVGKNLTRKTYSLTYKDDLIHAFVNESMTIAEIAEEEGLSYSRSHKWIRDALSDDLDFEIVNSFNRDRKS